MSVAPPASREQVLAAIAAGERFIVLTHENPDGDALGSLAAMHGLLTALGKRCDVFLPDSELPLPREYRTLSLPDRIAELPDDLTDRTIVFLDCGNIDRNRAREDWAGLQIVNVDHHHDNTLFGVVNHVVVDASCTAEIVWDLMRTLEVTPDPEVADAMYVALVTDTGRFMYENTGPTAHAMAADLVALGVDVQGAYRRLYEDVPYSKLQLLSRALDSVSRHDDGVLIVAALTASDFAQTGADESDSEGIIDHLRAVAGTGAAALSRERTGADGRLERKVSLRSSSDDIDVSAIAREQGGGGHRRAAGFATTMSLDELITFLRGAIAAQRVAA